MTDEARLPAGFSFAASDARARRDDPGPDVGPDFRTTDIRTTDIRTTDIRTVGPR